MRTRRTVVALGMLALLGATPPAAAAESGGVFARCGKIKTFSVRDGETVRGDTYKIANTFDIAGTLDGDLIGVAGQTATISGVVDGDVAMFGNSLLISGTVRDSVRAWVGNFTVTGTIEGDLIVAGGTVSISRTAHITGDVLAFGGTVSMLGTVDGSFEAVGGEVQVGGEVGHDADVRCDALVVDPGARISGNLRYAARKEIELPPGAVGGEVDYRPKETGKEEAEALSLRDVAWKLGFLVANLLIGVAGVGLLRRPTAAAVEAGRREALLSLGVGFVLAVSVPVAAVLAMLLVVTIPLSAIVLALWTVLVYVGKIPAGMVLGRVLLGLLRRPAPSPYASLGLGLPVLYVVFWIPYLGGVAWIAATCFGMGALVLGVRAAAAAGPASPAPGTAAA